MEPYESILAAQKKLCANRKHKSISAIGFKEILAKYSRGRKSKLYGSNSSVR